MTLTYVSSGAWGNGQGSPLTAAQHDGNIYDLDGRIALLEAIKLGKSVEDITSSGNIVTFHMSDGSRIDIAFELPSFRYRGTWAAGTAYAVNDIVTVGGSGVYIVAIAHTSAATFNPEATDDSTAGDGSDEIYRQLLPEPDIVRLMKWRGAFAGDFAYKQYDVFSSSIYGVFIVNSDHTSAATFDPNAQSGGSDLYTQVAPPPFAPVDTMTGTTHTVTRTDVGKYWRATNDSGCIIVFEDDNFDVGVEIHFEQAGAGALVFIGNTAVTIIDQRDGYDHATPYKGAVVTAKCVASATWKLIGPHGSVLTA